MIIIPAIDIQNGKCVRLTQGKFDQEIIYDDDPIRVAKKWEEQQAPMIHVVDLDGAKSGMQTNFAVIKQITKSVDIPIQVGGGVRSKKNAYDLFRLGVARIVLGTVALEDEDELKKILENFSEQTVVAIETRNGKLVKNGWVQQSEKDILETGVKLEKFGVRRFLYTDVVRDGMLTEPNFTDFKILKDTITVPIIVSGGIASISDVKKLRDLGADEIIIGKALYEKKFTLQEALNAS